MQIIEMPLAWSHSFFLSYFATSILYQLTSSAINTHQSVNHNNMFWEWWKIHACTCLTFAITLLDYMEKCEWNQIWGLRCATESGWLYLTQRSFSRDLLPLVSAQISYGRERTDIRKKSWYIKKKWYASLNITSIPKSSFLLNQHFAKFDVTERFLLGKRLTYFFF